MTHRNLVQALDAAMVRRGMTEVEPRRLDFTGEGPLAADRDRLPPRMSSMPRRSFPVLRPHGTRPARRTWEDSSSSVDR